VVDQALHQVEDAPAGEEEAEVHPPGRCEVAALPGAHQQNRGHGDEHPRDEVKETVYERVGLEPSHGVHRLAAAVAREHVVPLQDLVERDPVDEAAEPKAQDKGGCARRRHRRPPTRLGVR